MKSLHYIASGIVALGLVAGFPSPAESIPVPVLPPEQISALHETPTEHIQRVATETATADGLNPYIFDLLVYRESQWRPTAIGDHGLAHNVAQFHEATFDWVKQKAGMPTLSYENPTDQLVLMGWAIRSGYAKLWGTYQRLSSNEKNLLLQ